MKLRSLLDQIAGRPNYEAYSWGAHYSVFAAVLYHSLYVLRLASPLQWIKAAWRWTRKRSTNGLDRKERTDFHAAFTEYYFVVVLGIAATLYFNRHNVTLCNLDAIKVCLLTRGAAYQLAVSLLLIESVIWTVYYSVFRVFYERYFAIYDEAEYILSVPVAILTQILLIACLLPNGHLIAIIATIFNFGLDVPKELKPPLGISVMLSCLGLTYIAFMFASLMKVIPDILVRRRPNISIIGAGDVVAFRMVPALLKIYSPRQITVMADRISLKTKQYLAKERVRAIEVSPSTSVDGDDSIAKYALAYSGEQRDQIRAGIVKAIMARSSHAIIATPSDEHFPYMMELASRGIRFAVEKPLSVCKPHLDMLLDPASSIMDRGFLLSYYWLEKALPLNFFLTLHPSYRGLLEIDAFDSALTTTAAINHVRQQLGAARFCVCELLEGAEPLQRLWSELQPSGGMVAETLLHPMSIAARLRRENTTANFKIEFEQVAWVRDKQRLQEISLIDPGLAAQIGPTFVDLRGRMGDLGIRMRVGKYQSVKRRRLGVQFENGEAFCDLDKLSCAIILKGRHVLTIRLRYRDTNYETQMRLFHEFLNGEWGCVRFDDFPNQAELLKFLLETNATVAPIDCDRAAVDRFVTGFPLTATVLQDTNLKASYDSPIVPKRGFFERFNPG